MEHDFGGSEQTSGNDDNIFIYVLKPHNACMYYVRIYAAFSAS